jgi:DNA-binding NarL/FixJ family response regulator
LPGAEIGARLEAAARDGRLDPEAVDAVREVAAVAPPGGSPRGASLLTAREVQVLRLAARGLTNRAIAQRLGISDRTVGHHLAHVYDKTGRRTRAGVAVWAVERGLLPQTGLP